MRDSLFLNDGDRRHFLACLEKYSDLFDFRVHAYCLMDSHVHLLVESSQPNLSQFMHRLLTAYTVWFHRRHETHGHLFSGRFKSLVVDKSAHLLALSRYIHLNPVEAGMARKAEEYPWSSMVYYLNPRKAPEFLFTREILDWFGDSPEQYRIFVLEGLNEDVKPMILSQRFVGGKSFAKRIAARYTQLHSKTLLLPGDRAGMEKERIKIQGLKFVEQMQETVCRKFAITQQEPAKTRSENPVVAYLSDIDGVSDKRKHRMEFSGHCGLSGHLPGACPTVISQSSRCAENPGTG